MATYNYKKYAKIICVKVDDFGSEIVDEINTDVVRDAIDFIIKYGRCNEYKVVFVQMDDDLDMMTFDEVKDYFRETFNTDALDYFEKIRHRMDKVMDVKDVRKEMNKFRLGLT